MDFKDRFGLDYLTSRPKLAGSPPTEIPQTIPAGLKDAVITFGSKVLSALNQSPQQSTRLFDLALMVAARVDTLIPVMSFLVENGYVEKTDDPVGNDSFWLTDAGKKLAANIPSS